MGRTENVQVFQDTEMLCKTNQILIESTKKSVKNQKVILEGDVLPEIDKNRFEQDAALIVSKKRTYEAASAYKELKTDTFVVEFLLATQFYRSRRGSKRNN